MKSGGLALDSARQPSWLTLALRPISRRFSFSLRAYLFALAGAVMLPLLMLAALEADDAIGARQDQAQVQMRLLLANSVHGINQGVADLTSTAQMLARSASAVTGNLASFRQEADAVALSHHVDVVLRDASGAQRVATRVPPGAALPTLPPPDRQARAPNAAGLPYLSDIYATGMTHPFLARLSVPVRATPDTGSTVEVAFTPQTIAGWLNDAGRPDGWVVCVIGRNGQIISHSSDPQAFVGRGTALDKFGPEDGTAGLWQSFDLHGHPVSGVYTRLPSGWTVTVGAPDWLLARPLRKALISFGVVAALLLCGGTAAALWLAQRINDSVDTLRGAARSIGQGGPVTATDLPIRDFAFVQAALCHAGRDLAERRVTERSLLADVQAGRDLLRTVMDGSSDAIFAQDEHGRVMLANQAAASLLSLPDGQALLAPGDDGQTAAVGGRLFELHHSSLAGTAGTSGGTVSIARDVTERVAADARMNRLQADLARAGRLSAVAAMSAGLAHELHQPLSAAANFLAAAMHRLAALQSRAPSDAAPISEAMSEASAQVLRTGEIVQRLRSFIGEAEMHDCPVAPIVAEAAQAAWRHSGGDGPERRLQLDLDPAAAALVDVVSIQQVVSNLVRNAAEAMDGRTGLVCVVVQLLADGSTAVSVLDDGPGINPAAADGLFDVFSGSGKSGGLGVGLAICRTIISAHGGWITAENRPGGGAAFTFSLPPRPRLPAIGPADTSKQVDTSKQAVTSKQQAA